MATLDYFRPPTRRWRGVVLWAAFVLAFGAVGFALFSYITTRDTGAAMPTAMHSILRTGPLWFIYPYSSLIGTLLRLGEQGLILVVLEIFLLYPLYAIFFAIAAYRGRAWRLLIILFIVHLVLGGLAILVFYQDVR